MILSGRCLGPLSIRSLPLTPEPTLSALRRAARREWVSVICQCYIGNGLGYREGVDESAMPHYERYIAQFSEAERVEFLDLFVDPEFTVDSGNRKADARARQLALKLQGATTNVYVRRALELVAAAPQGTLRKLSETSEFKRALANLPRNS